MGLSAAKPTPESDQHSLPRQELCPRRDSCPNPSPAPAHLGSRGLRAFLRREDHHKGGGDPSPNGNIVNILKVEDMTPFKFPLPVSKVHTLCGNVECVKHNRVTRTLTLSPVWSEVPWSAEPTSVG